MRLGRKLFDFWWGQGIADDVPALAYYLVISLAPFALGIAALQAFLLEDLLSAIEIAEQVNRFLPEAAHQDVERLVVGTRDNSPFLLAIAIAVMLWTSSGAIGVIERCESRILECPRHNVVTGRIRNVGLGALVALAFVVGTGSAPVISDVTATLHLRGLIPDGLLFVLNALGSIALFAAVYRYAPRSRIGWRPAFLGALPAGAAIQAVPYLIGVYFSAAAGLAALRVFGLLAVLVLGLYVMATLMLVGAGIAADAEDRRRTKATRFHRAPGAPEALLHRRDDEDREPAAVGS